jgi:hypothetical protein
MIAFPQNSRPAYLAMVSFQLIPIDLWQPLLVIFISITFEARSSRNKVSI